MKIIKGQEQYYKMYETESQTNEKAKIAFDFAVSYANEVESLLETKTKNLEEAFETAKEKVCKSNELCGYLKNAAFTILTKTWVYGEEFNDYTVQQEDTYVKTI